MSRPEYARQHGPGPTLLAAILGTWLAFGLAPDAHAQNIVLPASPVDLGSVAAGVTLNGSFLVGNDPGGAPDLIISAIDLAPAGGDDCTVFTVTNTLPLVVPHNADQPVTVDFNTIFAGIHTCTLSFTSNGLSSPDAVQVQATTLAAPDIAVAPASHDFGDQLVNVQSAAQAVTITNNGEVALSVTDIVLAGMDPTEFSFNSPMGTSFMVAAGGGTESIDVHCDPTVTGPLAATLEISSDDPDTQVATVALMCNGIAPDIAVAPASHDFGDQVVGTPSAAQTITIANNGNAVLSVTDIVLAGANTGDFVFNSSLGTSFPVGTGGSATVDVQCAPTVIGPLSATLEISSNDPATPVASVALMCNGVEPDIAVAPASHDFGNQLVGTQSAALSVTITNNGNTALSVTDIVLAGANSTDFTFNSPLGTSFPVAAGGGTASLDVHCEPTVTGPLVATLQISSDDPDTPVASVALMCNGIEPDIAVAPPMLAFGDQRVGTPSANQTVTITNNGNTALSVTDIVLGGANSGDFAFNASLGTSFPVAADGGTATVDVNCDPTVTGPLAATLEISSDDPDTPVASVALTCNGVAPDIVLSDAALTFGQVLVADTSAAQTVTITNAGDFDLVISNVALSGANMGDFAFTPTTLTTIPASGTATIDITCTPSGPGMLTAALDISSDDPDEPLVTVNLDCTGMDPPIMTLVPDMLDFGDVFVNASSDLTFEVFNEMGVFRFPLNVTDVQVVSGDIGDFAVGMPTSFQVDAGNSQVVTVMFTPTAMDVRSAVIQVTSDDPINPVQTVMVTGFGRQRLIDVAPPAIDFGLVATGDTSPARTITVTNTGNALLSISNVALGTGAPFALMGNTSTTIQGGMSETWMLMCTPPAAQAYTDTLTFTSDADNSATVVVNLDCQGTDDPLLTNPTPIVFPDTYVGDAATPIDVDINNVTALPITVNGITITDNVYTLTVNQTVPFTLDALGTETITIDFTPPANQPYPALLQVDTAEHGTIEFPVDGRGVESVMQITDPDGGFDPISYDYGSLKVFTSSGARTFTITNVGTDAFTVVGMSISNVDDFTLLPPAGMTTLQPNESTTFTIEAHPRMVGARSGTVTIQTDIRGSMTAIFDVLVDGTSGDIELSDTSLDFGAVDVQGELPETRTLTITNPTATASDVLEIMDVQLSQSTVYRLAAGQATSASLAIGDTFDITVEYTPTVESAGDNATLTISADAATAMTSQIPISGRGIDRHIQLSAMNVSFPDTVRNPETPAQETVTISNTGDAPLAISMVVTGGPDAAAFSIGSSFMQVAPQGSEDLVIEFAPDAANPNYSGTVTIVNDDDERPMAVITLGGAGVVPNVALVAPPDLVIRALMGCPVRVSDESTGAIQLANMDSASFRVADVRVVDGASGEPSDVFQVVGFQPDTELSPGASLAIHIELSSAIPGTYSGVLEVYLGADPGRVAFVEITGEVVDPDASPGLVELIDTSSCPKRTYYACTASARPGDGGEAPLVPVALVLLWLALAWLRRQRATVAATEAS